MVDLFRSQVDVIFLGQFLCIAEYWLVSMTKLNCVILTLLIPSTHVLSEHANDDGVVDSSLLRRRLIPDMCCVVLSFVNIDLCVLTALMIVIGLVRLEKDY